MSSEDRALEHARPAYTDSTESVRLEVGQWELFAAIVYQGGGVYDPDNIMVVTPRYHKEALDPALHFNQ